MERFIRRSLETTNWQIAIQKIAEIEAMGSVQSSRELITVAEAAVRFLSQAESRELRDSTLKKFRVVLTRTLVPGESSDAFLQVW